METIPFGVSPWIVGAAATLLLLVAIEGGFRLGRRCAPGAPSARTQMMTVHAAILGLLSLLLGFSFSVSQSRFDTRRQLVIAEANAIGTTYLRAQMLPSPHRERAIRLLREYANVRMPKGGPRVLERAIARSAELHMALWEVAREAAWAVNNMPVVILFTQSLNETIDLHTARVSAHLYRAPVGMLLLLFLSAVVAGVVTGYVSGLDRARNGLVTTVMALLMASVLTLILDLEQPGRGLLQTSQTALLQLQRSLR